MKRLFALSLVAASVAAQGQGGEDGTIALGDVEKREAMALADRLLPPDIRGRVVEGTAQRQWLPGQVYWIGYRERGRAVSRDLCERMAYSVQLSAPNAPGDKASPDTPLRVGALESGKQVAVLAPGQAATDDRCATAEAFISIEHEPERRLAAYRVLVASMAAAARAGPLPFRIECVAEKQEACADGRKALASLPMNALHGIGISCTEEKKIRDESTPGVALISCGPIKPGSPYNAEINFGISGNDGQSWRASFVHAERWPETIRISRSMVIYH